MSMDDADRVLLARVRSGETDAWQDFIARFEGRLLAFARRRLGQHQTAEDVVQETLAGFLISLPNYDSETPLETWLFSIAVRKLTDALRRDGRRPALPLFVPDAEGHALEPAGTARRASSLMRGRETQEIEQRVLSECLRGLIAHWKSRGEFERLACIELLVVLGWPNKDVAQRLGISEQAVANHKQFVVQKLRESARKARLDDDLLAASFGLSAGGDEGE